MIKVFFKFNEGLWSRLTPAPDWVRTRRYRIPLQTALNMSAISQAQDLIPELSKSPVLEFEFKGEITQGHAVLELVGVMNF